MKDFVPPNEALELKHLGFDEPCFGYYDSKSTLTVSTNKTVVKDWVWIDNSLIPIDMTLAPTFSQAADFIYIYSSKQINIEIKASDTYEERIRKIKSGCENLRNLQNSKP